MHWVVFLGSVLGVAAAGVLVFADVPLEDPVWWLTNSEAPRVSVEGPAGPLRGTAEALLRTGPAERTRIAAARLDGQPLSSRGPRLSVDTTQIPDGPHRLALIVRDTSRRQNETSVEWQFVSDNHGPQLDVETDPVKGPVEGDTFEVRIRVSEPDAAVSGILEGRVLRLQPDAAGGYWALAGIPPEPGYRTLTLSVRANDALGNETHWERTYDLIRTKFPEEKLDTDPSIDFLAEQRVRAEENARLMPIYRSAEGPARWQSRFSLPVDAPVTTAFATRRSYNGRFPEGNHAGMDFGAAMGTPVRATAGGVVRFAQQSTVRGNVLILDHGAGVLSTYAHLSRFSVRLGDVVTAGQVVAWVGNTGLSTGPHLHWEIWVDGANVDPLRWIQRTYP